MKKITLAAAAVFAAIAFSSCGNSTPKADLKTDVDTLSYAMGVAQTGDFKNVLLKNGRRYHLYQRVHQRCKRWCKLWRR